jgi:hypothetical protein
MITLITPADLQENYQLIAWHVQRNGRIIVIAWQTYVRAENGNVNSSGEVWDGYFNSGVPDDYRDGAWWEGEWKLKVMRRSGDAWVSSSWVTLFQGQISKGILREVRDGILELLIPNLTGVYTEAPYNGKKRFWCRSLDDDGNGEWEVQE